MERITLFLAAAAAMAFSAAGGKCPEKVDWRRADDIAPGVKYICVEVDEPRIMANHLVRVDLRTPGLRVTGTRRPREWGNQMPDYSAKPLKIDAKRQTTQDFLEEHRANGTNMVFALNTSAWIPWVRPHNHKYGSFLNFFVSEGEVVSHATNRCPMVVVFTNNTAAITSRIADADVPSVSVAHPSYDTELIMKNGRRVRPPRKQYTPKVAPRTAMGLSADGRWLYALVVDGRQKGYSEGASMGDLARMLKAAGAADAVNMDGGGSATLVFWDGKNSRSSIPNRHNEKRTGYRPVAANMGFYFENVAKSE